MSTRGCRELHPNVRTTGFPVGVGTGRQALCWGCGAGKPGQPYAASPVGSRAPAAPAARCSRASLGLQAFPSGHGATWLLSLLPPSPAQRQSQVFQACVSKDPGCIILLARALWPGLDIWSASTPTARHPWALELRNKESRNLGQATLCVCLPSDSIFGMACLGLPGITLTTEASQGPPQGLAMPGLLWPGRVCSGSGSERRGEPYR